MTAESIFTVLWADENTYTDIPAGAGCWVVEDDHGEWFADLDLPPDGYYGEVCAALTAAGIEYRDITPVGPVVAGPTNPVGPSTRSLTWEVIVPARHRAPIEEYEATVRKELDDQAAAEMTVHVIEFPERSAPGAGS